jgi:hypothetical protein
MNFLPVISDGAKIAELPADKVSDPAIKPKVLVVNNAELEG